MQPDTAGRTLPCERHDVAPPTDFNQLQAGLSFESYCEADWKRRHKLSLRFFQCQFLICACDPDLDIKSISPAKLLHLTATGQDCEFKIK